MNDLPIELDVLAVFSHPDDAELSVAGTLLKLKSMGYRTGVCDLTRGEMGTRGTPEQRVAEAEDLMRLELDAPDTHRLPTGQDGSWRWIDHDEWAFRQQRRRETIKDGQRISGARVIGGRRDDLQLQVGTQP